MPLNEYQTHDINEKQLENLIVNNPKIISDNLAIIDQQVKIKETNDRIDILGINNQTGDIVIIDTKYNNLNTQNDFQLLKYISFVSYWKSEDILELANSSNINIKNPTKKINKHQKIYIIGNKLNNKVNTVFAWLRNKDIDVNVLQIKLYKYDEEIIIKIENIIPGLQEKYIYNQSSPVINTTFNKELHLEGVTKTNLELIKVFNYVITSEFNIAGPDWSKKSYVLFSKNGNNFINYRVNQTSIKVHIYHPYKETVSKDLLLEKLSKRLKRSITEDIDITFD